MEKLGMLLILAGLTVTTACVTETVEREPGMRFTDAAVVSVQTPSATLSKGSTIAWHTESLKFFDDERLSNTNIKQSIEQQIVANLESRGMRMVESESASSYSIAYTAALESSLDDRAIIQRYGLLPGNVSVPQDDRSIEKGSLIIYLFDDSSDQIIWRSAAQAGVHFEMDDAQRQQRIAAVVAAMFQSFPVK